MYKRASRFGQSTKGAASGPESVPEAPEYVQDALTKRKPVKGKVVSRLDSGYVVHIPGAMAFCPVGQATAFWENRSSALVGTRGKFIVIDIADGRVIVSRKEFLAIQRDRLQRKLVLKAGTAERVEGSVSKVLPFGAVFDFGFGLTALLHVSEMTHTVDDYEVGSNLEVYVSAVAPSRARPKITISERPPSDEEIVRARRIEEKFDRVHGRAMMELRHPIPASLPASLPPLFVSRQNVMAGSATCPECGMVGSSVQVTRHRIAIHSSPPRGATTKPDDARKKTVKPTRKKKQPNVTPQETPDTSPVTCPDCDFRGTAKRVAEHRVAVHGGDGVDVLDLAESGGFETNRRRH